VRSACGSGVFPSSLCYRVCETDSLRRLCCAPPLFKTDSLLLCMHPCIATQNVKLWGPAALQQHGKQKRTLVFFVLLVQHMRSSWAAVCVAVRQQRYETMYIGILRTAAHKAVLQHTYCRTATHMLQCCSAHNVVRSAHRAVVQGTTSEAEWGWCSRMAWSSWTRSAAASCAPCQTRVSNPRWCTTTSPLPSSTRR
jgi:hypothetical protein